MRTFQAKLRGSFGLILTEVFQAANFLEAFVKISDDYKISSSSDLRVISIIEF